MNHINWAWSHEYANPDSSNSDFFFSYQNRTGEHLEGHPLLQPWLLYISGLSISTNTYRNANS